VDQIGVVGKNNFVFQREDIYKNHLMQQPAQLQNFKETLFAKAGHAIMIKRKKQCRQRNI